MGKLDGKVAAITGSTRSIGRAIAEAYLREGAKVVINGRSAEKGAAAMKEMGGGPTLRISQATHATKKTAKALSISLLKNSANSTSWCSTQVA